MSSWAKVASGARLVASAVARQTTEGAGIASQRATAHGIELSSRARQTAIATQELLSKSANNMNNTTPPGSDMNSSYTSTSTGTNPYESQLRKHILPSESPSKLSANDTFVSNKTIDGPGPNPYLFHADANVATNDNQDSSPQVGAAPTTRSLDSANPSPAEEVASLRMKEGKAVPSSRVGRAVGFASLGVGLAVGTISEAAGRLIGSSTAGAGSVVASDANADRLAATLCRMRGAALKMGQMLSIQDESMLPPALTRALNQVKQGADAMPNYQLLQQLEAQLGTDWRKKFETFEDLPFAAASIGQVHRASIREADGTIKNVVVKVQYPGVANSIESDLRNLTMLVTLTGLTPKGLFIENVVRVGRDELKVECNYINEMANQKAFQELVGNDPVLQENNFVVPDVVEELTTDEVIVTGFAPGGTIDKVKHLDQEERNRIGRGILYLTMQELFVWRLMQTDPNWGNFLYDVGSRQTTLIDFGATREYSKNFVDGYLRIVWANANKDEDTLMDISRKMGFLTGEENDMMLHAHKMSGFTLGEPFASNEEAFDFERSRISTRMGEHTSVFLKHRLTPPPEEVYTLHRKLAGAYMLCIKLGAVVKCRDMLEDIVRAHKFEDGLAHPLDK